MKTDEPRCLGDRQCSGELTDCAHSEPPTVETIADNATMAEANATLAVAIVGSREGIDRRAVRRFVARLKTKHPDAIIVSGGARGVDSFAEQAAKDNGLETEIFPADWEQHGRSAGFKRNVLIVEAADVVVAFTTGSRGTQHTIDLAVEADKPVYVYGPQDWLPADGSE